MCPSKSCENPRMDGRDELRHPFAAAPSDQEMQKRIPHSLTPDKKRSINDLYMLTIDQDLAKELNTNELKYLLTSWGLRFVGIRKILLINVLRD
jgi:hypothetical protein